MSSQQPRIDSASATIAPVLVDPSELLAVLRFVAVGTAGTALQVALYVVAQLVLGTTTAATITATIVAFTVSTVVTNLVHRRVTYGVRRASGAGLDSLVAFATTLIGLGLSTVLTHAVAGLGIAWQVPMLIAGTTAGGAIRFILMKLWLNRV